MTITSEILYEIEVYYWLARIYLSWMGFCECNFILQVVPSSSTKKVRFRSNLFGSLGAGLFSAPNTIDFGSVFQNFDKKLLENIAVVATVLGVILLYIPVCVFVRRLDKKDAGKVSKSVFLETTQSIELCLCDISY